MIQRFGDVKKLITQTLDPMFSAYFRDVAHKRTMLELLQDRDSIQHEASSELGRKFHNFDIECVDVLIGKPDTEQAGGKIETLLEQLRLRQLSLEQVETYTKQVAAAQNSADAERGAGAGADADAAFELAGADQDRRERSRGPARPGAQAGRAGGGDGRGRKPAADPGRTRRRCADLAGRVFRSVGLAPEDPVVLRPAALCAVDRGARAFRSATSRWCPSGCSSPEEPAARAVPATRRATVGALAGNGVFGLLLNMLVAEKSGFQLVDQPGGADLREFTEKVAKTAMEAIQKAVETNRTAVGGGGGNGAAGTTTAKSPPAAVLTAAHDTTSAKPVG